MSLHNVKANAILARSVTDIGKKLDFLAAAIEELANALAAGQPTAPPKK